MTSAPIMVGGGSQYVTIQQGIDAAEASGSDTVLVAAGTYVENDVINGADDLTVSAPSGGVTLVGSISITGAEKVGISGLSFQGDGVNVAITALNSRQVSITDDSFTGTGEAVVLDGTTDSVVASNTISDTAASAIELKNGADANTVADNLIDGDGARDTIGAIWLHGSSSTSITHNQITHTAGAAISLADFGDPGTADTQNNDDLVAYNSLDQVDTQSTDSGAIYVLGRSQNPSTGDVIESNFIGTTGMPGAANPHAVGIYLDDNASGVSVTGNVVRATPAMTDAFEIHGGSNNTISGNIFDLGDGSTDFGLFQSDEPDRQPVGSFSQLQDDVVSGNVFVTESTAPHDPGFADLTEAIGRIRIYGNDFWAYSGAALNVAGTGPSGDSDPAYVPPAPQPARSLDDYSHWSGAGIGFAAIDTSAIGRTHADDPTCFLSGTLIRTPTGEVPIECVRIGTLVRLASGGSAPVRWVARQTIASRFAEPLRAWPVRVRADALADGVPARDLLLSPDHALFLHGVLVQAGALVNGVSIVREQHVPDRFTYYNLELAEHALIWAEGAAVETFVDNIGRGVFDNAAEYAELYPDVPWIEELPLPRAKAWRQVPQALRRRLADRARAIGAAPVVRAA